jgi:DNA/RNA-binding domain of Phe-tRNA-synthetase-like protein
VSEKPLIAIDPAWREQHPGAAVGVLAVRGVTNPATHAGLNDLAAALEEELRSQRGAMEREVLRAIPPLPAYTAYYKRWGQRYHVAMQMESVAQKGKPVPRVAALVEAMFVAELRNLLLTGGHDLDQIELPVRIDSGAGETFRGPNGSEQSVKPGDMFIADAAGKVLSAIITGPSDVARIGPDTTAAIVYVYAPPGVETALISAHLDEIERNIRLISPGAIVAGREIVTADG